MTNDSLYQQLLENPDFVAWVINPSSVENTYWQSWQRENPGDYDVFLQAKKTVLAIYGRDALISDEEVQEKVQLALVEAKERERNEYQPTFLGRVSSYKPWLAAAIALFVLGLGWFVYRAQNSNETLSPKFVEQIQSAPLKEIVNTGNSLKHIKLADGSSVVLFRNSKLSYPAQFSENIRSVSLSGDAFFEVTKDPSKPFYVHAGGIVAKVLGTSFSVKSHSGNSEVTVLVKTGKVSVYKEERFESDINTSKQPDLILLPNEQAVFVEKGASLTKMLPQQAGLLEISIEKQHFSYDHTPIIKVFDSLEKSYGVTIVFDKKTMANCSITAELGDEPLETKLEWICSILEADYQIGEKEIVIKGKACN